MRRQVRRKTPLYVATALSLVLLGLLLTSRWWMPAFLVRPRPVMQHLHIEPQLAATGVREDAQEAMLSQNVTVLRRFDFAQGQDSLKEWEQKTFKGQTDFKVLSEDGKNYLSSESRDACTGLFVKTPEPATDGLYLSWRWRVRAFPQKKHPELLSNRSEDDFAARVYVIFLASNFFRSDVIEYIWDERFVPGTTQDSPYSDRVKLLVIRRGPPGAEGGGWLSEERNLLEDYKKLFGKAPRNPLGLVALMSDSDNTGTSASADFADIVLKRKQPRTAA